MGNREGLTYAVKKRLNEKMSIGESRYAIKQARREAGESVWAYSDERIHSHGTRNTYQQHMVAFAKWAAKKYGVRFLEELDARADELATEYLGERLAMHKSADTLSTERSALRLFFSRRDLAAQVVIPERTRENITRSRRPTIRSREFQPANWQPLIRFLDATGLRDSEVKRLQIEEILEKGPETGRVEVSIKKGRGKGGRPRQVPVLPGHEEDVLQLLREGRDPKERVFPRVPSRIHVQGHRRTYAQAYYKHLSDRELPPAHGRLKPSDYDREAALKVGRALGHNRIDVVLRSYLR